MRKAVELALPEGWTIYSIHVCQYTWSLCPQRPATPCTCEILGPKMAKNDRNC
jgi:hypothetical protein